jgi:hypothetical protein
MRGLVKIIIGVALMATSLGPAAARSIFAGPPVLSAQNYPGAPRPIYPDRNDAPYAMTYTDEAVESLGFRNGRMDLFSTKPASHSYWPSFSGGVGGDGAMLKLQWHPGQ